MEIRDLLTKYQFDGDKAAKIIRGSATAALEGKPEGVKAIERLMDAIDTEIPEPVREIDKPFLMSVEDVFSITGRGTVATGRIERGVVKLNETRRDRRPAGTPRRPSSPGIEMFRKLLDQGQAGDNVGVLLRGVEKDGIERGQVVAAPKSITPAQEGQGRDLRPLQGRGRPPHAVLQRLPSAVLLPHDGRDRGHHSCRRASR